MKIKIAVLLLAMVLPFAAFAENEIYFNVSNGDETLSFTNQTLHVHPVISNLAMQTFAKPFSPDLVRSEYYQLTINKGIVWNGENIVQYDYVPLVSDRFRNVFWLTEDGKGLIKTEIYDTEGRLIFGATCMTSSMQLLAPSDSVKTSLEASANLNFFGFANIYSESASDGTLRMSFTDGLNKFSVFRTPLKNEAHKEKERMIMYGNYVFNKIYGDYKYTVVGTIPYSKMEEVVAKAISLGEEEPSSQAVEK